MEDALAEMRFRDPIRFEWMFSPKNYDDFIKCITSSIDQIRRHIEDNTKDRWSDNEDRTTEEIKIMLRGLNFFDAVEHDAQTGGHTDLIVRYKQFNWKAECKILGNTASGKTSYSDSWLLKGFHKLTRKYSKGTQFDKNGTLIIYIRKANTKNSMKNWKKYLVDNAGHNIDTCDCSDYELDFISKHEHITSGLECTIRHLPIILYDPDPPKLKRT